MPRKRPPLKVTEVTVPAPPGHDERGEAAPGSLAGKHVEASECHACVHKFGDPYEPCLWAENQRYCLRCAALLTKVGAKLPLGPPEPIRIPAVVTPEMLKCR